MNLRDKTEIHARKEEKSLFFALLTRSHGLVFQSAILSERVGWNGGMADLLLFHSRFQFGKNRIIGLEPCRKYELIEQYNIFYSKSIAISCFKSPYHYLPVLHLNQMYSEPRIKRVTIPRHKYASTYVHERDLSRFFAPVLSLRHHLAANEQERARGRRNEYIIRGRNNG